ncbi:hypothetical protein HYS01_04410 [Candidatus Saccharibacteria bacterium]|nr:hypothetical protein [Candidatus Saccharibacteria bacterium]
MTKTKKKTKVSVLSRLRKPQMMIAMVFVLGFGGFGVYKLAFSSAATYQTSCRTRYLKLGDQGNCVKYLQMILNDVKAGPLLENGKFDSKTTASVITYEIQLRNTPGSAGYKTIKVDGIAGPEFADAMCARVSTGPGGPIDPRRWEYCIL